MKYLILLMILLLVGCTAQEDVQDQIDNLKELKFSFETEQCDATSVHDEDEIKSINWIDDTLVVETSVIINCAEEVLSGDYEIINNKIILKYEHSDCTTCTTCVCANRITYRFENIEKKDYEFEIS